MKVLCATILGVSMLAASAFAKPPLRDVPEIDNALFNVGLADVIRKNCPTISARKFKAVRYIMSLNARALDLGYTKEEIKAYTDSDVEKDRMRAKGKLYFAARGVDPSDPESYCAVGLQEIQKASLIGSLLRAK